MLSSRSRRHVDPMSMMSRGLRDLTKTFGRSSITHLAIRHSSVNGTMDAWTKVFQTFTLLEELVIGSGSHVVVENIFLGLHAASRTEPDSTIACPKLTTVDIQGRETVEGYDAMCLCFRDRRDSGVVLTTLDLRKFELLTDLHPLTRLGFHSDLGKSVKCVIPRPTDSELE